MKRVLLSAALTLFSLSAFAATEGRTSESPAAIVVRTNVATGEVAMVALDKVPESVEDVAVSGKFEVVGSIQGEQFVEGRHDELDNVKSKDSHFRRFYIPPFRYYGPVYYPPAYYGPICNYCAYVGPTYYRPANFYLAGGFNFQIWL